MCWANTFLHQQTCSCVCERRRGREREREYFCSVWGVVKHILHCIHVCVNVCQPSRRFSHEEEKHASYETCHWGVLKIIGRLVRGTHRKGASDKLQHVQVILKWLQDWTFVKLFMFYLFCMIGSRTECRRRLGKALLSVDKEESCYHTLCVFICVCVWVDWVEMGGRRGVTQIKHPFE